MNVINLKIKAQIGASCSNRAICTRTANTVVTSGNYLFGTANTHGAIISMWESIGKVLHTMIGLSNYGIYCALGKMYCEDNGDGGSGNQPRYGLLCQYAGTIGKYGTQPQGSIANEATAKGGVIRS